jgi:adenosylcobinamide-phosphate synthase
MPLRWSGILFAGVLVCGTLMISLLLVRTAYGLHPGAGFAVETVLLFYCLSTRSLADAADGVREAMEGGGIERARRRLAMIVGRETDRLEEPAIWRAVVETVSENLVDGVLAPLFYAAVGGAPLALAYKMVNTLDSMVGYKNDRYLEFGWGSARLDDAAAFLPARLSVPLIATAGELLNGKGRAAWNTARRDGRLHASPNAGIPEAAFSGALGVRLGGPNVYHGRTVEKPWIGETFPHAAAIHADRSVDLMILSAVLAFLLFWAIRAAGVLL